MSPEKGPYHLSANEVCLKIQLKKFDTPVEDLKTCLIDDKTLLKMVWLVLNSINHTPIMWQALVDIHKSWPLHDETSLQKIYQETMLAQYI